ncbi:hypothetical protein [uncultured Psychroserpens sp.]|nr:hypothetical protein [uncultured Psychroserpens sp.]
MKKQQHYMSYRTPADMHSDGVYFNEELLARKQAIDEQLQKINERKGS